MRFQLTQRLMTLDDLELLQGRILSEFRTFGSQQRLNQCAMQIVLLTASAML